EVSEVFRTVPPKAAEEAGSAATLKIFRPVALETEPLAELICALDPDGLSFLRVNVTIAPLGTASSLKCLVSLAPMLGSANAASVIAKTRKNNLRMLVMLNLPV